MRRHPRWFWEDTQCDFGKDTQYNSHPPGERCFCFAEDYGAHSRINQDITIFISLISWTLALVWDVRVPEREQDAADLCWYFWHQFQQQPVLQSIVSISPFPDSWVVHNNIFDFSRVPNVFRLTQRMPPPVSCSLLECTSYNFWNKHKAKPRTMTCPLGHTETYIRLSWWHDWFGYATLNSISLHICDNFLLTNSLSFCFSCFSVFK